jgi:hypothetical protein
MCPSDSCGLAEEAASLGLDYVDTNAIMAFNKNRKKIKHWGTAPPHASSSLSATINFTLHRA